MSFCFRSLSLILLFFAGSSFASPSLSYRIQEEIQSAEDRLVVSVSLTNSTDDVVRALRWLLPGEGEQLFSIRRQGSLVRYLGPVFKRPSPRGEDFVEFYPGETKIFFVDLTENYDFSARGNYFVEYTGLAKQSHETWMSTAPSPGALEVFFAGSASKPLNFPEERSCSDSEELTNQRAFQAARAMTEDGYLYLNSLPLGEVTRRYSNWFGEYDHDRFLKVYETIELISIAMDVVDIELSCQCEFPGVFAYVYPTDPFKIYLCDLYWTAPMTGTDSKGGTIVHELSHFQDLAATEDFVYSHEGAENLAETDPWSAVWNADSYEYFVENTPFLFRVEH